MKIEYNDDTKLYTSNYVLVRTDRYGILQMRLEGIDKDRLLWYSPAFDDNFDSNEILAYTEIPKEWIKL